MSSMRSLSFGSLPPAMASDTVQTHRPVTVFFGNHRKSVTLRPTRWPEIGQADRHVRVEAFAFVGASRDDAC